MTERRRMNPLAFYAMAYAGAAATQKGVGFIVIFWLAQALPVEDYAQFGLMFALQSGVAMLAGAGILDSVIGLLQSNATPDARARLFRQANGVLLQLSLLTIVIASMVYLVVVNDRGSVGLGLSAVLCGGALLAYFTHQATLVRLEERHRDSLLFVIAGPLTGFLFAFLAFREFGGVDAFFFGMASGLLASAFVLRVTGVGAYGIHGSIDATAKIRARLLPFLFIALLSWLAGYGNTYIVKLLFQSQDVARFTFLFTVSSIMHLVATSTNQVWSPRFFRLVHDIDRADMEARNARFYVLQGGALGITGAAVLLALPPALQYFGGNLSAYQGLEVELFLLFAGYAVSVPWWHAQNYFLAFGKGSALMRAVFASSIVGLIVWVLLMVVLGDIGIYVGFLVQMCLRSAWVMVLSARRWGIRLAWPGVALALLLMGGALATGYVIDSIG
ncbi:MAG: lipopolysaccharide biosynthesis protein [Gammaproteobacteria bacterium]